jgi:hypothetical protein
MFEKEGSIMAGYSVSALALDWGEHSSRFVLAASVVDNNGLGVPNLSASNFAVHNLTGEMKFTITEVQAAGLQGFYRLILRAEPISQAKECILALIMTDRHHVVGRIPEQPHSGSAMVKVKVV